MKRRLLSSRRATTDPAPRCPICGNFITTTEPADMHEVFLTRGDVQGASKEAQRLIHIAPNCVLVHHGNCHVFAATREGKDKCALQILVFEGYHDVKLFLQEIVAPAMRGNQAEREINYINDLLHRLIHSRVITPDGRPSRSWQF